MMLPDLVSMSADIAQLVLIGVALYVAYCVLIGAVGTLVVGWCVLAEWREDRRALRRRLREDREVAALEQIPRDGEWEMVIQ